MTSRQFRMGASLLAISAAMVFSDSASARHFGLHPLGPIGHAAPGAKPFRTPAGGTWTNL
jgi:hypothetical protein